MTLGWRCGYTKTKREKSLFIIQGDMIHYWFYYSNKGFDKQYLLLDKHIQNLINNLKSMILQIMTNTLQVLFKTGMSQHWNLHQYEYIWDQYIKRLKDKIFNFNKWNPINIKNFFFCFVFTSVMVIILIWFFTAMTLIQTRVNFVNIKRFC